MPSTLRGEIPDDRKPAGTASARAARIPGFQLIELASRGASGQRSDAGGMVSPSAAYTSCGSPHAEQKQLSTGTAWWQRLQVTSMMFQAYSMRQRAVQSTLPSGVKHLTVCRLFRNDAAAPWRTRQAARFTQPEVPPRLAASATHRVLHGEQMKCVREAKMGLPYAR